MGRRAIGLKFVIIQLKVAESQMDAAGAAGTPEDHEKALAETRTALQLASFALGDLNESESDVRELLEKFKALSLRMSYAPKSEGDTTGPPPPK